MAMVLIGRHNAGGIGSRIVMKDIPTLHLLMLSLDTWQH